MVGRKALEAKAYPIKHPADFEKEEEKSIKLEEMLIGIARMAQRSSCGQAMA